MRITEPPAAPFADFASSARARVDTALDGYTSFSDIPDELGWVCPPPLREAMRYSLLASGKRLRPLLALMSARACGAEEEAAMPAACAVEMVHCYSLIHDDLPCMDDDDLRRGKPTCHKVYGEATATLAGDALLALALEVLARDVKPPHTAARCCSQLAKTAGATALVGGQIDDLAAEGTLAGDDNHPAVELSQLTAIHARKTAAMISTSARLGGMCAGAGDEQLTALTQYGHRLGLAFQITDDLLDVRGDENNLGKRVRKDCTRRKLTYPALLGVAESQRRATTLIEQAVTALEPLGERGDGLSSLAWYVLKRDR